jgi:ribonuclease J
MKHLHIIPLGGLGEIGRNMTLLEFEKAILIVDMGLGFPEEDMPGIDYTIPNVSYFLKAKREKKKIVGILFTHGHYDHIGAIPYLLPKIGFDLPMFASELTKGIILKRQEDFKEQPKLKIKTIKDGDIFSLGPFQVEAFRLNHNVPGNLGFFIKTPIGNINHTPDFKFDKNPVNDPPTDFEKLKNLAKRGVLLLMMDSTGAEEKGHSLSEKEIFENLDKLFKEIKGRIFIGTFASLLNRIQQIITLSEKYGRKVAIEGYSMRTNVEIARELGYLKYKKDVILPASKINKLPESKITVICTGAQGEGEAALMRIANQEHKHFKLKTGDSVIFSSSVIPGNERTVQRLKDQLYRQKVNVFHYQMLDIHAGGHAKKEELKQMLKIMKPKFFMPIHGQYSMLANHAQLAKEIGILPRNIVVVENGQVVSLNPDKISIEKKEVPANLVMVDGLGVGDVGEVVLRDRQQLSQDGMFVIIAIVDRKTGKVRASPDIISRGFVYLRESKELLRETRKKTISIINKAAGSGRAVNWTYVKDEVKNKLGDFLFAKTERRPMILPVIIEV